jgi:large conductance mechanosensitive channel
VIKEFKEFINRGNVVDLAVAVVIGAAFGAVVTSFVNDILMQVIAAVFGQPDFSSLTIHWGDQIGVNDNGLPLYEGQIFYGSFLNALISFMVIAFGVFLVVKAINRFRRQADEDPGPTEVELLAEIRDALKQRV